MKSDKGLRNQDAPEVDLLQSDKVCYLKLAHFWNVFFGSFQPAMGSNSVQGEATLGFPTTKNFST